MGVLCLYLFCYAFSCVHSNLAIILKRKRKLVALLLLSYRCIVAINVLWFFPTVPWVGLLCVIMVFPDHTRLLFETSFKNWRPHNVNMMALQTMCSAPVFKFGT